MPIQRQARNTPKLGTRLFLAKFLQKYELLTDSAKTSVRVMCTALDLSSASASLTERSRSLVNSASVMGGSYLTPGRSHKTEFIKAIDGPASIAITSELKMSRLVI